MQRERATRTKLDASCRAMGSLQGKTAVVTGAGSGIGRATALRFVADRHGDPVEAVAAQIRDAAARVDELCNNAGIGAAGPAETMRARALIRVVPRLHGFPMWQLRRISPRLAQPLARGARRILRV